MEVEGCEVWVWWKLELGCGVDWHCKGVSKLELQGKG